jgi:class 3 adenylate cyclase
VICQSCGTEVPDGADACESCGAAYDDRAISATGGDELRPVTALFADIVGSTGLGERLRPDEVKALVGECITRMSRAVEEYGGVVESYMGDGICACFGVPSAHEDDPDRAAEAALAVLTTVASYAEDIRQAWGIDEFNVRVGINSGLAAVGAVGAAQPRSVVLGDMTNIAARIQAAAEPGTILVGEGTARRVMPRFSLEPVGTLSLKGREAPVPAWRLIRRKTLERDRTLTPLVGREAEAGRLERAADDLRAGRGQSLLLLGEAGVGKSRLIAELRAKAGADITWLEGDCRSYGSAAMYWPFVEMFRGWLGVEPAEREIVVRTRLRARISSLYGDGGAEGLPFIAHLLSVELEPAERERLHGLAPEELAARIRAAYCGWLDRLAVDGPVVVAIEDLHDGDAASSQLLEEILELTDRAPVMIVVSARPETGTAAARFRAHAMTHFAHRCEELTVQPISDEAASRLLDVILTGPLDQHSHRELIDRAEGNPLYLEEMARGLGSEELRPRTLTITAGTLPMPPSLEALLVARIDRLDHEARALGQLAAIIGRHFSAALLTRVAGQELFNAGLPGLLRSGVVREQRRYPELEYSFRHVLLQQAARATPTPERRAALFASVAEAFEELYADSLDDRMEVLAHYHAQSGNRPRALVYLERAGDRAAALGQPAEATRLWERALRVAEELGDEQAGSRLRDRIDDPGTGQRSVVVEPRSAVEPQAPARGPTRVGRYALERPPGGTGETVRAITDDGGMVIVHLVGRSAMGDDASWQRFAERVGAARRVDSPNLVTDIDVGEADGWRYLAHPMPPGGTLADRIRAGQAATDVAGVVRTVAQVAVGLESLHRQGLVHGDPGPASVVFDADGRAALIPIAAPSGDHPTVAGDIYALGSLTLAYLEAAFGDDTSAVPADIMWSIQQARADDPGRRPTSAAMFAQMLRTAQRLATTS